MNNIVQEFAFMANRLAISAIEYLEKIGIAEARYCLAKLTIANPSDSEKIYDYHLIAVLDDLELDPSCRETEKCLIEPFWRDPSIHTLRQSPETRKCVFGEIVDYVFGDISDDETIYPQRFDWIEWLKSPDPMGLLATLLWEYFPHSRVSNGPMPICWHRKEGPWLTMAFRRIIDLFRCMFPSSLMIPYDGREKIKNAHPAVEALYWAISAQFDKGRKITVYESWAVKDISDIVSEIENEQ